MTNMDSASHVSITQGVSCCICFSNLDMSIVILVWLLCATQAR